MILKIKNLTKVFQQGAVTVEALKPLSFEVAEAETLAILGPSGSGKSTLLSLLGGLEKPSEGSVELAGKNLNTLNENQLADFRGKNIGIVFQQFHLLPHLTALENVALPLEIRKNKNAFSVAAEALDRVGLGHRKNHQPHELSGGECQRVAIARALVVRPALLLADEPSGNLDSHTGRQVMELLFDLVAQEKTTLILVTHNESLAARCGRQLLLG
jgi:putative ABC transport system ATP-binding protein